MNRLICRTCGQPITDTGYISWNGHVYHTNHVPPHEPPPPENRAVLRALRLIQDRVMGNRREDITLGDIEWAIQELERDHGNPGDVKPATLWQEKKG